MINRRSHHMEGELGVIISLAVSLGMIILTIVGLWIWQTFPLIVEAMTSNTLIDIPWILRSFLLDLLTEVVLQPDLLN